MVRCQRFLDAARNRSQCRLVKYAVNSLDRLGYNIGVRHVPLNQLDVIAIPRQILLETGTQIVENADSVSALNQRGRNV